MSVTTITAVLAVLGLICLIGGCLQLRAAGSFFAWLKAGSAVLLLVISAALGGAAWEMRSFAMVNGLEPVASVSISQRGDDRWSVTIIGPGRFEQQQLIQGNQAQVGVQVLSVPAMSGRETNPVLIRLETIKGRYTVLEDAVAAGQGEAEPVSAAQWVWRQVDLVPGLRYQEGKPAFMPLREGALYDLWVSGDHLVAGPANPEAETAWEQW